MKDIKIGLLGFGTVGAGVVEILEKNAALLKNRLGVPLTLAQVADLDISRDRGVSIDPVLLTTEAAQVVENPDIDIVVELIGGYEPARTLVMAALACGKSVVTANKALLARHGEEIYAEADRCGGEIFFEASVGGGIPLITSIKENLGANHFHAILGILNGTCNYILTRMTQNGESFGAVLKDAQEKGFAEADPTFDVEGIDTAHKLAVLIGLCFGSIPDFRNIYVEGISRISSVDIDFARQFGYVIKLLAISKRSENGIEARVHPTMLPEDHPLAAVDGVFNAVEVVGDYVGPVTWIGQGAGRKATASAVVGDILQAARNLRAGVRQRTAPLGYLPAALRALPIIPMDDLMGQFYLRFSVIDRPGVLGRISTILGEKGISIASMIQMKRKADSQVPVVMMTHRTREAAIRAALERIDSDGVNCEPSVLIRIENSDSD
ncbi:MAG: homoserine dehydrogenase [Deltaproteobacteria bacterium]|nr:homoserine dehydrogenase [Deltaproteobacteria bacterium]